MRKRILSFVLSAVLLLMPALSMAEAAESSYFAGELTTTAIGDSYMGGNQINLNAVLGLDLEQTVEDKTLSALAALLGKAQVRMSFYDDFGTARVHAEVDVDDINLLTADALIYEDGAVQVMTNLTGKLVLALPAADSETAALKVSDFNLNDPEELAAFKALPAEQRLTMTASDVAATMISHLLGWVSFTQMETGELYAFDDTYLEATEVRDPVAQRMLGRIQADSFNRLLWNTTTTLADDKGDLQQAIADVLAERGVTRYQARVFTDSLFTEETIDPALDYVQPSYYIIENQDQSPICYDDVSYFFKKLNKCVGNIWDYSTDNEMTMDVSYDDFGGMVGFDAYLAQFTPLLPYEGDFTYSIKTDDDWQRFHTSHGELQVYHDNRIVGDLAIQFGEDVGGVSHSHLNGQVDVVNQKENTSAGLGVQANLDFEVSVNDADQDQEVFEGVVVLNSRTNGSDAAMLTASTSGRTTVDAEGFVMEATAALGLADMGLLVADMKLEQGEYEEIAFAGGQAIDMSQLDEAQKDVIKSEIVAQAAKLSLSLVTKPDVLANLMTVFGTAMQ